MASSNPVLAGTPGDDNFAAPAGSSTIIGSYGIDTVSFGFRLLDAQASFFNNLVFLTGPTGMTVLSGIERFQFTDGLVNDADGSPLIDDLFYDIRYKDVWQAGFDADVHYRASGAREGRDPNAFFSTSGYLAANPDVAASGIDPLTHYDLSGWREGRNPSSLFDTRAYLAGYADVAAAGIDPLAHFLQYGQQEGRQAPAVDFDAAFYLQHNPDVAAANTDPRAHFETYGWREGRDPNAYFDTRATSPPTGTWRRRGSTRSTITRSTAGARAASPRRPSTGRPTSPPTRTWPRPGSIRSTTT